MNSMASSIDNNVSSSIDNNMASSIGNNVAGSIANSMVKEMEKGFVLDLTINVISALHLGSGQADVNLDAEVVHDHCGVPYFPAKRLKGLLYESALEVVEMAEASGQKLFSLDELNGLFQHGVSGEKQLIMHNFYLPGYEQDRQGWAYLQAKYPGLINARDVLEEYTSIRYQTSLDKATHTALDHSLHNIRVVEAGCCFRGSIQVVNGDEQDRAILALACRNLQYAGGKRNRGMGRIECRFDEMDDVIRSAVKQVRKA